MKLLEIKNVMNIKEHQQVWSISFLIKKGSGPSANEELARELNKLVINKFKGRRVYANFKDDIWGADLAEIESLFSKNGNVKYSLCVINLFTKYV